MEKIRRVILIVMYLSNPYIVICRLAWQIAFLAIFTGQGYTKDMYETLRKESGGEHKPPPGLMFHVVSFEKSGNMMHAAEVRESEEQLNDMISTRLMPLVQKHKMPLIKTETYEAHNINALPEIEKIESPPGRTEKKV
jgi:hypothetical protein